MEDRPCFIFEKDVLAMDDATLSQRILDSYDDLTRRERKLADLLLEDADTLVLKSATDISEKAGVSKATTARFFRRLGYPSFKAAQKVAKSSSDVGASRAPTPRAASRMAGRGELAEHLAGDVQNLVRSIEALRSDELRQGILSLARAEKLWIVGFAEILHVDVVQPVQFGPEPAKHRIVCVAGVAGLVGWDAVILKVRGGKVNRVIHIKAATVRLHDVAGEAERRALGSFEFRRNAHGHAQ